MRQKRTGRQLHKNQRGFSLIEVILAMAILAIIAVPLCHSFITAAKTNAKARRQASANAVAENVMEGINAYSYEEIARQFSGEVATGDFLISHNCDAKGILSGVSDTGECDSVMRFWIDGVDEDTYQFDVRVTVDAQAYIDEEGMEGINDAALTSVTNYNADMDYLFTFDKADDIAAKQALAGKTGGAHTYQEFDGKVQRTIRLTLTKGNDGTDDYVRISTEVIYQYIGAEGWLSGSDATYSRSYGSMQYSSDSLLRNAYICYLPLYDSILSQERDRIEVINTDNVTANLYLIKQIDASGVMHATEENTYVPFITLKEGRWAAGQTSSYLTFYNNFGTNIYTDSVVPTGIEPRYAYSYFNESNMPVSASGDAAADAMDIGGSVATVSGNRLYHVTVEVYKEGTYDSASDTATSNPIVVLTGN